MNMDRLRALHMKSRFDLNFLLAGLRQAQRKDFEPLWTLVFVAASYGRARARANNKEFRSNKFYVAETCSLKQRGFVFAGAAKGQICSTLDLNDAVIELHL
jgi:hypothetical protein